MKPDTFIILEDALTAKLAKAVKAASRKVVRDIAEALADQGKDAALAKVGELSLAGVFEDMRPTIELHTYMGLVFGASQVAGETQYTTMGRPELKEVVERSVEGFRDTLKGLEAHLVGQALQLIAQETVQKAEEPQQDKQRILHDFESSMDEKGAAYLNIESSLHTSRVSAYGFTAEALALGLTEYQITEQLDKRTCPVCREMHGKTFRIADARNLLEEVTRTKDSERLKMLQPWPSQSKAAVDELVELSADELVERGWHVPPFHPRCRGLLTRVGRVPPLGEAEMPKVTPDDFSAMGLPTSKEDAELWAEALGTTPAAVLALMSGQDLSEVLKQGQDGGLLGLVALHLSKTKLKVTLKDTFGVLGVQIVELGLQSRKLLVTEAIHLSGGTHKQFMQAMFLLSKDTGMRTISIAVAGTASYEWAQRGFYPATTAEWGQVKVDLMAKYKGIQHMLSEDMQKRVERILKSANPKDLLLLVDLEPDKLSGILIGRTLLDGISWQGQMSLLEPESMSKFMSYIL